MAANKHWIKQLQQQNQEAFEYIYDQYFNLVSYVIFTIVGDTEVTKELVQDSFLKMWNNIDKFRLNTNFKAWLLTIAKNTAKDYLRTKKEYLLLVDEVESNQDHMSIFSEFDLDAKQVLNDFEYNVVALTIVYNLKRREVADVLEKPTGTISRVYSEAIKKLKDFYSQ
ncbi:MAG: sigma-70 family RNA polymerase sigma factor [Bacilli bacterium]|nr:sigma-70 family RNA polymerase sigma factor [Bacilli bacterium]